MKNVLVALALVSFTGVLVGCTGDDANYEQKVELTPEQEAQRDKNMAGQQAPGTVTPGQPIDVGGGGSANSEGAAAKGGK